MTKQKTPAQLLREIKTLRSKQNAAQLTISANQFRITKAFEELTKILATTKPTKPKPATKPKTTKSNPKTSKKK